MNELFRLNRKPKQNQKPLPDVKEFRTDHLSREVEDVKIVEIIIGDRIRDDTHTDKSIADLASSIEAIGLLQPIVLNEKNNMLVCGERRLEAYKKLGRKEIPVLYVSDMEAEKLLRAEADENIQRKGFSFFQIMAHVEKIEEEVAKRREAGDESVKGEETRDLVAKAVGWGYKKLSDAKTIMQNAIPEVIQAIGIDQFGNGLSIHSAFKISQLPKNQQLQALNEAVSDPSNDGGALSKFNDARRKTKRLEKTKTPAKHKPHRIFRIVRVAPDWGKELSTDIRNIPVLDYMYPAEAFCVVQVPGFHLQSAMSIVESWGLTVDLVLTVWAPRCDTRPGASVSIQQPLYIIIAHNFPIMPEFDKIACKRTPPVIELPRRLEKISDAEPELLGFIDAIFIGDEKRICMSSTEKQGNWISWKSSYGVGAEDPDDIDASEEAGVLIDEMIEDAEVNADDVESTDEPEIMEQAAAQIEGDV